MGVLQTWRSMKSKVRRFLNRPALDKIGISLFFSISISLLRTYSTDQFMDMSVWWFVYLNWCFFVLPTVKDKLTMTMVWNVVYVIIALFLADGIFYGLYGYAKRYFNQPNIGMESTDMKSCAFFMNAVRICCILFCIVRSSTKFVNSLSPVKSPRKYNLRKK